MGSFILMNWLYMQIIFESVQSWSSDLTKILIFCNNMASHMRRRLITFSCYELMYNPVYSLTTNWVSLCAHNCGCRIEVVYGYICWSSYGKWSCNCESENLTKTSSWFWGKVEPNTLRRKEDSVFLNICYLIICTYYWGITYCWKNASNTVPAS